MKRWGLVVAGLAIGVGGCGGGGGGGAGGTVVAMAPEVALGQRLFRETRFAQFFAANCGGDVNVSPPPEDPVLAVTATPIGGLTGPLAGATMSCSACHLHTEAFGHAGPNLSGGLRTFGDFAARSPIPQRGDGLVTTPRNSPPLVGVVRAGVNPFVLHFDGEFADGVALSRGTLIGRNYGWLVSEQAAAKAHVAKVIREDLGTDALAATTGGLPYAALLRGDPGTPAAFLIPPAFRIDPATASDDAILDALGALIDAFMQSLDFRRDAGGDFDASAYDRFLVLNGLPRHPAAGESDLDYLRRLRTGVAALANPVFVPTLSGSRTHAAQGFKFEDAELAGLRVFLAEPATSPPSAAEVAAGGIGNCLTCHSGPRFSDFLPHNVGVAQEEYDAIHGAGAFGAVAIPDLATRAADPDAYLPATVAHPAASGVFRAIPDLARPGATDLGAWNVLGNADFAPSQASLLEMVRRVNGIVPANATPDVLLPFALAAFKTTSLRSIGLSGPYFHTGRFIDLESVCTHYATAGAAARSGLVRNADPHLGDVALVPADVAPLAAFLRSLSEDYR